MLRRRWDGRSNARAEPSYAMPSIAVNYWFFRPVICDSLGDDRPGNAFHTTLFQHTWIRRGCSGHDRETMLYIGYNTR
jgi:hypothetical protein